MIADDMPDTDKDEYEEWLSEVDKKEMEEAQENWEEYREETELDDEDNNKSVA